MRLILPIIALLALGACATGDPIADCRNATNAVSAAQAASILAETIAESNPQSDRMQQAAKLAAASLTIAIANQARACPAI